MAAGFEKPVAAVACGRWLWKACGCTGLWPLVVESLWLQWPVAAGCGEHVAAIACGRVLWQSIPFFTAVPEGPIHERTRSQRLYRSSQSTQTKNPV